MNTIVKCVAYRRFLCSSDGWQNSTRGLKKTVFKSLFKRGGKRVNISGVTSLKVHFSKYWHWLQRSGQGLAGLSQTGSCTTFFFYKEQLKTALFPVFSWATSPRGPNKNQSHFSLTLPLYTSYKTIKRKNEDANVENKTHKIIILPVWPQVF